MRRAVAHPRCGFVADQHRSALPSRWCSGGRRRCRLSPIRAEGQKADQHGGKPHHDRAADMRDRRGARRDHRAGMHVGDTRGGRHLAETFSSKYPQMLPRASAPVNVHDQAPRPASPHPPPLLDLCQRSVPARVLHWPRWHRHFGRGMNVADKPISKAKATRSRANMPDYGAARASVSSRDAARAQLAGLPGRRAEHRA